ncbi:MAG: hypothetical protein ACD_12C00842G0002 [uncultured bacterium]|nr:MAG: hypothetical protein ACD_12C00842G0002 [uncultured bacterium]
MLTRRQKQVNSLIKKEISELIEREIELPQSSFVTVTEVKTRSDLNLCQIGLTIFPLERKEEIFRLVRAKKGLLQSVLHKKLVMKNIPKIDFYFDESVGKAERVEKLLDSLKEGE